MTPSWPVHWGAMHRIGAGGRIRRSPPRRAASRVGSGHDIHNTTLTTPRRSQHNVPAGTLHILSLCPIMTRVPRDNQSGNDQRRAFFRVFALGPERIAPESANTKDQGGNGPGPDSPPLTQRRRRTPPYPRLTNGSGDLPEPLAGAEGGNRIGAAGLPIVVEHHLLEPALSLGFVDVATG